jgi:XTP/dITP diphosphohydrolase
MYHTICYYTMDTYLFITGNVGKIEEAANIFGEMLKFVSVDAEEIQSLDGEVVIKHKCLSTFKNNSLSFMGKVVFIEDTSLEIENMNKFPGALVKFYYQSLGDEGLVKMNGGSKATMISWIAICDPTLNITIKKFSSHGTISHTPLTGSYGFGFDAVFIPDDCTKSLAQMSVEEKNLYSSRCKAFTWIKNNY